VVCLFFVIIQVQTQTLYDQTDLPSGYGFSCGHYIWCNFSSATPTGGPGPGVAQFADDFLVPAQVMWNVTSIQVTGFYLPFNSSNVVTSWNYALYIDGVDPFGTSVPTSILYNQAGVIPSNGLYASIPLFVLPNGLLLSTGKYWLSVWPNQNSSSAYRSVGWYTSMRNTTAGLRGSGWSILDTNGCFFVGTSSTYIGSWVPTASVNDGYGNALNELLFIIYGAAINTTLGAITSGSVTSGAITSGPVTSGAITSGSVTSGAITIGSVTSGAITSVPITSGGQSNSTLKIILAITIPLLVLVILM